MCISPYHFNKVLPHFFITLVLFSILMLSCTKDPTSIVVSVDQDIVLSFGIESIESFDIVLRNSYNNSVLTIAEYKSYAPGRYAVPFSFRDNSGQILPNGIYFVVFGSTINDLPKRKFFLNSY